MGKKFYFQEHDESCYDKIYHLDYMAEHELKEMIVFEAVREKNTGYFFCKKENEVGETGLCGKELCGSDYVPANGKRGMCKHYGGVYVPGKKVLFKRLK